MYIAHFGLSQRPFSPTADTANYYPATTHELALARLRQALALEEGLAVLTAESGMGKTLIAHRLLDQLDADRLALFVTNTHFGSPAGLFQTLLFDLGQPYEGRSEHELRLLVTEQLLQSYQEGRPALLVIDEAHHLSPVLLEELRMLGNLETREGKVLQTVLAGLPLLAESLARPINAAVKQRLRVQVELQPLDQHESADYIAHLARAVSKQPAKLFTDEAIELLARSCRGVPRLLNQAADLSLQLAASAEMQCVDAEPVLEALEQLGLGDAEGERGADAGELREAPRVLPPEPERDRSETASGCGVRPRRLFMSGKRSA